MPLLDAGFDGADRPYVVTEFCVTGSLQDHLLAVGRLTPTRGPARSAPNWPTRWSRCTGGTSSIATCHRPLCSLTAAVNRP
jgi:hypothetical protein